MSTPELPEWARPVWWAACYVGSPDVWPTKSPRRVFATFEEAEAVARKWYKAGRGAARIYYSPRPWEGNGRELHRNAELVATIADDALGRIWTDITYEGAKLVA